MVVIFLSESKLGHSPEKKPKLPFTRFKCEQLSHLSHLVSSWVYIFCSPKLDNTFGDRLN